ncbi:MAG TPA: FAD-dependent oxidoreductase, partial [Actinomycetota bacterium]|nr:FAD-dependent oxidoreductase [Actinomycetota bacterium]
MSTTIQIPPDHGRSWWLREALALPEFAGDECPPLVGDTTADVVILGGGYTGMWSAWFLKELDPGVDVVLLEQDICGGGPSGRNGGFVDSFWGELTMLCERFGDDAAVRVCEAGEQSVRAIGAFCEDRGFDAWFRADGELNAASSTSQIGAWADDIITADRLGLDHLDVLTADEVREKVDSPVLRSGVYSRFSATVQPARLARGLRSALLEKGVRIHEGTPVSRFGAGSPAIAETPGGTVRAGAAVLAMNAWAQHWRRFKRAITVRGSFIVVTAAVPDTLEAIGWTNGMGLSDFRASLHYVRTT